MLWLSARLEWKNLRRDRSFWLMLGLFGGLVLFAAIFSGRFLEGEARRRVEADLAEAARFDELRAQLPADTLRVGQELLPRVAHLPPAPLAPVSLGQRELLPQTVKLTTRPRTYEGAGSDALSAATGPFDLAFVLVFLLPLLVIGASFDLLSREREQGTLSLVLSQPVALATFLSGKAATRMGLLFSVTLAVTLGGAWLAGARFTEEGGLTMLALFVALALSYTLFWFALALWVNARGRSSAANALTLMVVWLGLVVVVPGLASVAVDSAVTGPSRVELVTASRDAAREAAQRLKTAEGNHGSGARPSSDVLALEREYEAEVAPIVRAFDDRRRNEQRLVDRLRFVSPALLVHEGLADVSGTGPARQRHFAEEVDRFHGELRAFFEARIASGEPLTGDDYDAMPRFRWVEPGTWPILARVGSAVIALLVAALLLLLLALRRLRRASLAAE
jgi:ABC-2 type transport system permease protein